ncbi:helical backbone metal receptor [Actinomadura alba]|uniref:ABC transporter substrate-binding protein n=1 Tax=Actinomadura alba TaxID=406431 RepID=A0ABR7M030_9ACTN|nr:ABC transporter substrate-binding protein [Actinomadura alba]
MRPVRAVCALLVLCVMTLSGCGRSDTSDTAAGPAARATPVVIDAGNGKITIPATPKRIVALSPTATEILFAIGAGPQVVAVDDQSNHPANAPKSKLSGFKPNAEAVIGHKPDLVVLASDIGGIVKDLEKVGIPVLLEPSAVKIEDTYDQIADLGRATGHAGAATTLAQGMRQQIEATVKAAPQAGGLTYYHELGESLHSATSKTFIGQVYALFGLRNIADRADERGDGYPQLSPEYLLKADPDLIFLADTKCCGQSADTVAGRTGWDGLAAVKNENVVPLDDDVASRWGPRLVDLVKAVGAAVQKAAARQ